MRRDTLLGDGAWLVFHNVGHLLRYISAVPLLLLVVIVAYREWHMISPVLGMSAAMFVAGQLLVLLPARRDPRLREGLTIAAFGWLFVPLGSIILFWLGEGWRPLDAYFEAMSAWTGTGVTLANTAALSHTSLMWRSLMQWVGGLGVIVLTLAVLARPGTASFTLYAGESREDKLRPSVVSTVRTLWRLYAALTVAGILVLLLAGLPVWDAINHAMTGIGTAGMSTQSGGIGDYDSLAVELALLPIMIVGSMPFVATYALLRGRVKRFWRDEQVVAGLVVLGVAVPLVAWLITAQFEGVTWARAARDGLFQAVSIATTTGFQTADLSLWDARTKIYLVGLMLIGGAAGSTAGGLKLVRAVLLFKGALWKLRRSGLPYFAVTTFPFSGDRLSDTEANEEFAEASFILVLWAAALFIGLLVFLSVLPAGVWRFEDVLFEVASLQNNNGVSVGIVNIGLPNSAKIAGMALMWAGRLEILPVLLLLRGLVPRLR